MGGGGGKGGGGGSDVTIGYRYYMGVQVIGCLGPVDEFQGFIVGERQAWAGAVTNNQTININAPDLFGGDAREGGVAGDMDIMMGEASQPRNDYLIAHQGPNCPAYRGLFSVVFKRFLWSSGNPYFKSPWLKVMRARKGWENDNPWHPELALINGKDMNPAHIIYQCFTDSSWGMGYPASDFEEAEWLAAAQQLYDEDFGLSLEWDQQSDIETFVQGILNHINGSVGVNLGTGKFRLKLIRDDYDINSLVELNIDNITEVKSFQRATYGDSPNELVVTYTDRDQNTATVAVQDLASIQAQGAVISSSQNYPGIRDAALAARVGMRDLRALSSPLAKAVVITNRVLWDKDKGDVVRFNWPPLGVNGAAFRIIDIDKGTLSNGSITVTLVEDIFGLPANSYIAPPVNQWVDTLGAPIAAEASRAVEASYWDVIRQLSLANMGTLMDDYGFGMFMASRGAVRSTLNYRIVASPDDTNYTEVGIGHFNPVGDLVSTINATAETVTLTGAFDLDNAVLSADGGYAYIEDECVSVISVDPSSGVIEIRRGILDTVPSSHPNGAKMFFVKGGSSGYDRTERTAGESVYYKALPTTGLGTLDVGDAVATSLTLNNRASRPYPPGNFKIDGNLYPTSVAGPAFTVSWAHRDRSSQTVDFIDYKQGNIGPEPGTTYRLRVFSGATLKRTYDLDGSVTAWQYPSADDAADGNIASITISVHSVRDGLESLYGQKHTFNRLTAIGSVGIETRPATPTLTAEPQPFAIKLKWTFGDTRTNIEKVEIRVADSPSFANSTVYKYVNYPDVETLHELGTALTFKWYWLRTIDTGGQLSEWSTMAWARSSSSAVTTQAILDAVMGNIDETALTPELQTKINSIDGAVSAVAAQTTVIDGLKAQYTVKVDNNGYVAGYGLASTLVDGAPLAEFTIVADKFSIAPVATNKDAADGSPFFYLTSPTTINGIAVPAGAYIKDAYISNLHASKLVAGTVTADKISADAITADKIAANAITADKIAANTITADKIDSRGLSIKDAAGNVILSAGSPLASADPGVTHIQAPAGGYFASIGPVTGALKIILPNSWTNSMIKFDVEIYEFATGNSCTFSVSGFNQSATPAWFNPSAKLLGSPSSSKNVRFGHDGSKCCIWIGELASTWAYPQVRITNLVVAYSNFRPDLWATGWGVVFDTVGSGTVTAAIPLPTSGGALGGADKITAANASTYIADAAIGAAQIGSLALVGTNSFSVKTALTGARMEMDSKVIKVFDEAGIMRVKIGDLSA